MARHRITLEFEATTGNVNTAGSRAGWSETFYRAVDEDDGSALNAARTLSNRRRLLLTEGWSLSAIRVSRLDGAANLLRRGILFQVPPADQPGTYIPGAGNVGADEQPYDAIDLSINSAGGNHRAFLMRGIGRDVISAGARFMNPAQWAAKWPDFWGFLTNNVPVGGPGAVGWSLRIRTQFVPPGSATGNIPIVSLTIVPSGPVFASPQRPAVYVNAANVPAVGATIVISNVLGLQRINGSWIVNSIEPPAGPGGSAALLLKPKRRTAVSGSYQVNSGQLLAYTYSLDLIQTMTAGNGASRRTGRPLNLVRGRRSPRPS